MVSAPPDLCLHEPLREDLPHAQPIACQTVRQCGCKACLRDVHVSCLDGGQVPTSVISRPLIPELDEAKVVDFMQKLQVGDAGVECTSRTCPGVGWAVAVAVQHLTNAVSLPWPAVHATCFAVCVCGCRMGWS
jgi:hypothetical protein